MYKNSYNNIKSMADQIVESAQESGKTPERKIQVRQGLMEGVQRTYQKAARPEKSQEEIMAEYMETLGPEGFPAGYVEAIQAGPDTVKPVGRNDVPGQTSLTSDPDFMGVLNSMKEEYPGLTDRELFLVIKGESSFKTTAKNDSGARGLFQIMPDSAQDAGVDYDNMLSLSAADQLREYKKYLDFWGYDGSYSLGVLQGAPAYRNAAKGTVVYEVGSPAWEQNKGWRSSGDGPVTVGSMDAYYKSR